MREKSLEIIPDDRSAISVDHRMPKHRHRRAPPLVDGPVANPADLNPDEQPKAAVPEPAKDFEVLWGAEAIGKEIGVTPRVAFYLCQNKKLKGVQKVGGRWCATRKSLRANFEAG